MLYEGDFHTPAGRFAVVAARFNAFIVDPLLAGAQDAFARHGVTVDRVDVIRVPGSFEIPLVAQKLAESQKFAAVICLGCIIRGETDHYDHVAGAATKGVLNAGQKTGIPVIYGVLTCETLEQAIHRAGAKAGNKGYEAVVTAIEMANLLEKLGK